MIAISYATSRINGSHDVNNGYEVDGNNNEEALALRKETR